MAQLTLDSITKRFGDIVAVDDVSIDIADGEFLVLVGPSGSGKSTALRMLAGLESVTGGEIRLDGRTINDVKPQDRDVAMVFQSYALYPHMTVRDNMGFGLEESTDLPGDEIDARVEEAAEMMGIGGLLDRRPTELSGGQQQRVALGRAIVRDPEVFLLDEPLANLDAKLRSQMRTELQRLQENLDTTTVYVTHDQTEAMTMGDRIAVLDDGRLQQVGTPLELYHQPANRFVAGFIGEPSMNFLEMEVRGDRLVGEHLSYSISQDTRETLGGTAQVTLGIRPEDIEVREAVGTDEDFEMVIDVVEPMGNEHVIYLSPAPDAEETLVATVGGMQQFQTGQPVVVRIPEDAIHLFESETGEAVMNRSLEELEPTELQF